MIRIPILALWLGVASTLSITVLRAQDFSPIFSGAAHPLSLKLKEVGSDWRRFTLRGTSGLNGNVSVNVSGSSSGSVSQNNLAGVLAGKESYVTRGQITFGAGRTYLVAYHLPPTGVDVGMLLKSLVTKAPPTAAALTEESSLSLSLLDVATMGSLEDIQPFEAAREVTDSANAVRMLTDLMKAQSNETKKPDSDKAKQ